MHDPSPRCDMYVHVSVLEHVLVTLTEGGAQSFRVIEYKLGSHILLPNDVLSLG